jgi:hypothetical protein
MKKITIVILFLFSSLSVASADLGVNVGLSGQVGVFHATGVDTNNQTTGSDRIQTEDATGVAGYNSWFIEKTLGRFITVGYDYVLDTLASDSATSIRTTCTSGIANDCTIQTNKVQVDFDKMNTLYVAVNITENLYIKLGQMSVDVITNEKLETGSTYGNTSLDGDMYGIGFNKTFDNTMFVRVEATRMDFDGAKMISADNTVELKDLEGGSAKVSIGKSF